MDGQGDDAQEDWAHHSPMEEHQTLYIIPILIHDEHSVHVMGMIVNHVQSIGLEMISIPAGKIYELIGSGKQESDGSVLDKESIVTFAVEGRHERIIAGWPIDVYTQILDQIGRNALMKGGIE